MSSPFFSKLESRISSSESLLCIGLDPHVAQLSTPSAEAARDFCLAIIKDTHQYAAAFKPNSAFFEAFGVDGASALESVIKAVPSDIPIILDVKRGDIDTTAQAYAEAAMTTLGVGCVTLSPYMGLDSIRPFVTGKFSDRAAFVLCKTSNASSKELQEETLMSGSKVYERVAGLCASFNAEQMAHSGSHYPALGLVVGATDLIALRRVRALSPESWILCPGVGAQGGEADSVCEAALRQDGSGLLVSVSRGISQAKDMGAAAKELRDSINASRHKASKGLHKSAAAEPELLDYQREFISFAIANKVLEFGSFKLKSGRVSPYFFNAGRFCSGESMHALSRFYAQAIHQSGVEFDVIFGPAYKGIPLATAVSVAWLQMYGQSKDVSYNRKEAKDHGEGGQLVGASIEGRRVLIVDDVITAGTAIRESVEILSHAKAIIVGVTVSLDRQEKASDTATQSAIQQVEHELGQKVVSIVRLKQLVAYVKAQKGQDKELADIQAYRATYGVDY